MEQLVECGYEVIVTKRIALWSAVVGYVLTMLYYFGPGQLQLNETVVHLMPYWVCILAGGHGTPVLPVAVFVAPINALIYGAVGAIATVAFFKLFGKSNTTTS